MTEASTAPPSGLTKESLIGKNLLIYQSSPVFEYCSNTFIDVPVILQFEESPLIAVIREVDLTYTTEIRIYHSDGTYLAKVKGVRVFAVPGVADANIKIRSTSDTTICTLAGATCFEIKHSKGDSYRLHAELYTPNGWFIKGTDRAPQILSAATGKRLDIQGTILYGNTIKGSKIGVLIDRHGNVAIGVGSSSSPTSGPNRPNEVLTSNLVPHKGL
jgi:hypothetical protein